MNATPNSAIYKFITSGNVDCTKLDRQESSGQVKCRTLFSDYKAKKFKDIHSYVDALFGTNTCIFDPRNCISVILL